MLKSWFHNNINSNLLPTIWKKKKKRISSNPSSKFIPKSNLLIKLRNLAKRVSFTFAFAFEFVFTMWGSMLKNLRWTSIFVGLLNIGVIVLDCVLLGCGLVRSCSRSQLLPFILVMFASFVRILAMVRCAVHQYAVANAILGLSSDGSALSDDLSRVRKRLRYKRWLGWTRFATIVTVLQFLLAMYLIFMVAKYTSLGGTWHGCSLGNDLWKHRLLVIFLMMVCFGATLQCFASADVLRWRSFYERQDDAWKAHYKEVFDHGIREVLCCLGRVKYLKSIEEDEVHSVAQLLGDLVTYRASGTGHLDLLAGLALLQRQQFPKSDENSVAAPFDKIQEATVYHPYAEAAYTGPLLDVGRNFILFPCAWLYRQGILTAWSRNRRPVLHGDNWWRGHAAAFLNYTKLSPDCLRRGRVNQGKCQVAYFIVVLHHVRTVVIAVRGTETPEDLLTDGLCREIHLTTEDLDGLINGMNIDPLVKQTVMSSFPHYGHSGIVEAARDLYNHIEGHNSGTSSIGASVSGGYLSSLLGPGCECEGYAVRIVGHSLGGAIAALLGIRLNGRFPDLHVYSYGPLPCVDSVVADACSSFITSIVHNCEFSSFLSVNSILRLRAAALTCMAQSGSTDTAMTNKLAQLFLCVSKYQTTKVVKPISAAAVPTDDSMQNHLKDPSFGIQSKTSSEGSHDLINFGEYSRLQDESSTSNDSEIVNAVDVSDNISNPFTATDGNRFDDPVSQFMQAVPSSETRSADDPPEVFLPGLVIHLIRQQRDVNRPVWKGWRGQNREQLYKAIVADRENFKEILISPYMFLDHLPWRCRNALESVMEFQNVAVNNDSLQIV